MFVTLSTLRTRALQRARHENGNQIAEDAEVNHYINLALAHLSGNLVGTMEFSEEEEYIFTPPAATDPWAELPDNLSIISVTRVSGDNRSLPLPRIMSNSILAATGELVDNAYDYRVTHGYSIYRNLFAPDQIRILQPESGADYAVKYVPVPQLLVNDYDEMYDRNHWSEYVVLHAAIQLLRKERFPTEFMEQALKIETDRISREVINLDQGSAPKRDGNGPGTPVRRGRW